MTRDDKLMTVAAKSRQPLDRVMFVWIAILESASECEDGGRYAVDPEMVAYTIRCEPADVTKIMLAMEVEGRVSEGVVMRWKARQFESDTSRDRMRRHRNAKNGGGNGQKPHSDDTGNGGDGTVTSQNRTVTTPETDTEADTSPDGDGGDAADERQPELAFAERPRLRLVEPEILLPEETAETDEARFFRTGKEVLKGGTKPIAKPNSLLAGLWNALNKDAVTAQRCVDEAVGKHEPAEFLGACLRKAKAQPPAPPARVNSRLAAADKLLGYLHERAL
jgi:hypothetical protein